MVSKSQAYSELGHEGGRTPAEDHLNIRFGEPPINAATWCIFARGCMWASFQVSRTVILIGSLLEDEHSEEPVILHDQAQIVLGSDEWKSHYFFEKPMGTMLTAEVHVLPVHQTFRKQGVEKATVARTETTLQVSRDTDWYVCLGDTSVQILHKLQQFMSETGHDITNWESRKVQDKCLAQANEVATHTARLRPGYWCFCGRGSE